MRSKSCGREVKALRLAFKPYIVNSVFLRDGRLLNEELGLDDSLEGTILLVKDLSNDA